MLQAFNCPHCGAPGSVVHWPGDVYLPLQVRHYLPGAARFAANLPKLPTYDG